MILIDARPLLAWLDNEVKYEDAIYSQAIIDVIDHVKMMCETESYEEADFRD